MSLINSLLSFVETYWIILLIIAIYWQLIILFKKKGILEKFNITNHGPMLMIRTVRGQDFLNWIAKVKSFWRLFADIGIILMIVGMLIMFVIIIIFDISTLISLHKETLPPPTELNKLRNLFLIPGINDFIPFVWGVIALVVTLVVHEFSHAILCRVEDIRVKSMGLILVLIPIGAFAEPDEDQLFEKQENAVEKIENELKQEKEKEPKQPVANRRQRVRILSAGVMANFVTSFIAFILFFIVIGSIAPISNVLITEVEPGSPADIAEITDLTLIIRINDKPVGNVSEFFDYMNSLTPGETIRMQIKKDSTIQEVVLQSDPELEDTISGVRFDEVIPDTPAKSAGLIDGMIITRIDDTTIPDTQAFINFMTNTTPNQKIVIYTLFANGDFNYTVNLKEHPMDNEKGFIGIEGFSNVAICRPLGIYVGEYPAKELLHFLQMIPSLMTGIYGWIILLVLPFPNPFIGSFQGFSSTIIMFYEPIGLAAYFGSGVFWAANSLLWIMWMNFYVGLFNCLPMLPLDGGHVLKDTVHSILERLFGDGERMGEIAGKVAAGFAILMLASLVLMVFAPSLSQI
ncbi:MAG: site-2 protease family protein [Methanosarcinales archaeon]|nr:site-2 protease family protein [Methanosarcinales archaeon]